MPKIGLPKYQGVGTEPEIERGLYNFVLKIGGFIRLALLQLV